MDQLTQLYKSRVQDLQRKIYILEEHLKYLNEDAADGRVVHKDGIYYDKETGKKYKDVNLTQEIVDATTVSTDSPPLPGANTSAAVAGTPAPEIPLNFGGIPGTPGYNSLDVEKTIDSIVNKGIARGVEEIGKIPEKVWDSMNPIVRAALIGTGVIVGGKLLKGGQGVIADVIHTGKLGPLRDYFRSERMAASKEAQQIADTSTSQTRADVAARTAQDFVDEQEARRLAAQRDAAALETAETSRRAKAAGEIRTVRQLGREAPFDPSDPSFDTHPKTTPRRVMYDASGNPTGKSKPTSAGKSQMTVKATQVLGPNIEPETREVISRGQFKEITPSLETSAPSGTRVTAGRGGAAAVALEPPQTPDEWIQAFKRGVAPDIENLKGIGREVQDVVAKIEGQIPKSSTTKALQSIGVGPGVAGKLPLIGAALSVPEAIQKAEKGDYAGSVGSIVQNFSVPTAWAMQTKSGLEQYAQDTTSLRRSASGKAELPFWMRGGALETMLGAGQEGSNVRKVVRAGSVSPERAKYSDIVVAGSAGVAPGQLTQTDIASGKGPGVIRGDEAKSIEQEIIGPDRPALVAKKAAEAKAEEERRQRIREMERIGPKF